MIKAVIFDQDGVIFDSEPVTSKSYDILLRSFGKNPIVDSHGLIQPVGLRGDSIWKVFKQKYDIQEDTETLRKKRREIHLTLLQKNLQPMLGLLPLLKLLREKQIMIALATGSPVSISGRILDGLDIREYFNVIVNGEDVTKGKPDPECFLVASKKLNIPPEDCVVLEDSVPGVLAGKAAGMKVIAVPTTYSNSNDFSRADKIMSSLKDISWEVISSL